MVRPKHKPQRTCIACRKVKDKRDLVRVVKTPDGNVMVDLTGKANGRGAYLCRQADCWHRSLQGKILDRALKTTLSVNDTIALQQYLETDLSKV
jgi:hypothetical protein